MDEADTDQPSVKSSIELAGERTDLAVFRTSLAAGRSLMAWVRTGLAMIGFGFTVYKFMQSFADQFRPGAAHTAGLILIGVGTFSILVGCIEYWQASAEMRSYGGAMRKTPLLIAGLIAVLGVLLFLSVSLRIT